MGVQRPKPIADQVYDILRQRIRDRKYPPGGRMPAESDLAQTLGVSRATVRTVLARLSNEGFVIRRQGDGTYVNERIQDVDTRYGGLWDFSRLIRASGYTPTIAVDSIIERPPRPIEQEALQISEHINVISMLRLFRADDKPAIWAHNLIPAHLISLAAADVRGDMPIHQLFRSYCECEISYAITDVEATVMTEDLKRAFAHPIGFPLIKLREVFFSKENDPLVFGQSYFDHSVLKLRMVQAWG